MKSLILLIAIIMLFSCKKNDEALIQNDTFTDSRDNQTYKTKVYGSQTWFIENLAYNTEGSRYYNNEENKKYGRLYNYKIAQNSCPDKWHLPSDNEWTRLEEYLDLDSLGNHLKSKELWDTQYFKGKNSISFNALPVGIGTNYGDVEQKQTTYFWTSTKVNENNSIHRRLSYFDYKLENRATNQSYYYSIRCIKDE